MSHTRPILPSRSQRASKCASIGSSKKRRRNTSHPTRQWFGEPSTISQGQTRPIRHSCSRSWAAISPQPSSQEDWCSVISKESVSRACRKAASKCETSWARARRNCSAAPFNGSFLSHRRKLDWAIMALKLMKISSGAPSWTRLYGWIHVYPSKSSTRKRPIVWGSQIAASKCISRIRLRTDLISKRHTTPRQIKRSWWSLRILRSKTPCGKRPPTSGSITIYSREISVKGIWPQTWIRSIAPRMKLGFFRGRKVWRNPNTCAALCRRETSVIRVLNLWRAGRTIKYSSPKRSIN